MTRLHAPGPRAFSEAREGGWRLSRPRRLGLTARVAPSAGGGLCLVPSPAALRYKGFGGAAAPRGVTEASASGTWPPTLGVPVGKTQGDVHRGAFLRGRFALLLGQVQRGGRGRVRCSRQRTRKAQAVRPGRCLIWVLMGWVNDLYFFFFW